MGWLFLPAILYSSIALAEGAAPERGPTLVPELIRGRWITVASDREGVSRLAITLNIGPSEIGWTIDCDLPDGSRDHDSVSTPIRFRDGALEIVRAAGNLGDRARPCELGIREKALSWHLEADGSLRLADYTGKVRTFTRTTGKGEPPRRPLALQGGDAVPCVVTPAQAELRLGERGLFKVSAPGFSSPSVRTEMHYGADPSGGFRISDDSRPVRRALDAVDVADGTVRIIRSYDVMDAAMANQEGRYASTYPGGVVETVELRQGTRRALCHYRVRLVPKPVVSAAIESQAAGVAAPW
jgi:hypothetical protein